jgi:hypothetical protein
MPCRSTVVFLLAMVAFSLTASSGFAANLLDNPTMTGGITPWSPFGTTPTASVDDANGSLNSGSLQVVMGGDIPVGAVQCANLGSEAAVELSMTIRRVGVTSFSDAYVYFNWYDAADCGGSSLPPSEWTTFDPSESWTRVTPFNVPVPNGAVSARVFLGAVSSGNVITVQYDDVYFGAPVIFEDGFDTADTTRWTATAP